MGFHFAHLFTVYLLHIRIIQGTGTRVFVQTGKDLFLAVQKPVTLEDDSDFLWKYNHSTNLVKLTKDKVVPRDIRAESSRTNYSLLLKNVQKNDSGDYTAFVYDTTDHLVAKYQVTVQDPVSPVELTVNSVSRSSDSCLLTVTCRVQDGLINSTVRCANHTCSQEGGQQSEVTASGASLQVYLVNDSLICNHSNQVSQTEGLKMIKDICPHNTGSPKIWNITAPIIAIFLIILVVAVVVFCIKRGKLNQKQKNNYTVSGDVRSEATAQPLNECPSNDFSGPTSTYCLVGPHPVSTDFTQTRSSGTNEPKSLYACVSKPARS